MVILHIANIDGNKANGMSSIIPKYIYYQSKKEEVAILNINSNTIIDENKIKVFKKNKITTNFLEELDEPFNNPDVIIMHGIYYLKFMKILEIIKRKKIPYILVPHGCLSIDSLKRKYIKKKLGIFFIFSRLIKNANSIQYLSENERKTSLGNKRPNFISHNGVEKVDIIKKNYKEEIVINYIGRISAFHKGLDLIVDAVNLIQNVLRDRKVKVYFYGPNCDNDKEKLEISIKKYGIQDIIFIKNAVFDEQKIKILEETDIFIQTSRWEGQPVGLIEAMSYGNPVIITNGTNLGEEVVQNKCGWVVDCTSNSIANGIYKAIDEYEYLSKYGLNSKNYIDNNLIWDKIIDKCILEYKNVVNKIYEGGEDERRKYS